MSRRVSAAVIVFPGSNCDRDCARGWEAATGQAADFVWHKDGAMPDYDVVIIPGGFSFGDYLRCGAIARFSPIMNEVLRLARRGSRIIGICNGFQILTEARLLPGALLRNRDLLFICRDIYLRVENARSDFTAGYRPGQVIRYPIAHGEGGFTVSPAGLKKLQDEDRVVLRYCDPEGRVAPDSAPNGSLDNIAGLINEEGNILGLMPHPERLSESILGGDDGRIMFQSIFEAAVGAGGLN
ncbi:MAG: phosphoribosylformylglycinamidine synthase subunit PurQ [Candidatus Adiutrix sp.]|jgi:phosphoribosylformylglycinamidine synthase|nr:phosphoribosylformylglycinamidine synthase subunit PurQ [Candidatus Adiutrix sp.]